MSDSALEVWKEIYKIDDVKNKTSFEAIDLLLNGFSASKRNKILIEVFSTFKSTFIAYRFIYFNFIKEKIPKDEKVKVLNPYDLEPIDVKKNIEFQKVTKASGSGFKQGSSMCPICLSLVYDNRFNKRNPRAPDFKCSAQSPDECKGHDGRFSKSWWLDSKDLPPEWSESTIIAYDDNEKLKFKEFCLRQVKKNYPKLKDTYTYSHIEKKLLNVVWVSKQDTELLNFLDDPLLKYKNLTKKFTYWSRNSNKSNKVDIGSNKSFKNSRSTERNERSKFSKKNKNNGYTSEGYFTSELNKTRSYPDGGYRTTVKNKRLPESKEAPQVSKSVIRFHLSSLKSHPHFIKREPILNFASHFNIGTGWKNRENNITYGGPMDTSRDLTMGAVYPIS